MVINHFTPLHVVLERLGCGDQAKGALFFWDEVKKWPSGALDILVTSGLLQPAQPMTSVECDGCQENCFMPVTVYPAQEDKPGRAFITCVERDDIGRVRVDFRRMEQWQTTGESIATALAQLLDFSGPAKAADGKTWNIGVLIGKVNNKSLVVLQVENSLKLSLAGHIIPLSEVLTIKENALALDKAKLVRLVNNPVGICIETPEARRERLVARIREERATGTKAFNQVVAKEEGISLARLKQLTAPQKAPASLFAALMSPAKPSSKKTKSKH